MPACLGGQMHLEDLPLWPDPSLSTHEMEIQDGGVPPPILLPTILVCSPGSSPGRNRRSSPLLLTGQAISRPEAPPCPHPATLALLQGVLPSRPEEPVCETTQLAGNSSAPWGSLGAVTKVTGTGAHRA